METEDTFHGICKNEKILEKRKIYLEHGLQDGNNILKEIKAE